MDRPIFLYLEFNMQSIIQCVPFYRGPIVFQLF